MTQTPALAARPSVPDDLPIAALHAHLSTLSDEAQLRAFGRLADYAHDRLHLAAVRVLRGFVPSATALTWRRAPASHTDLPPITDLTVDCDGGASLPVALHDELDSLDIEVPARFSGLFPVESEDADHNDREQQLLEHLAAGAGVSVADYRTLLQAANVLVSLHPVLEAVPLHE